jgi:hypothetical protein
MPLVRRADYDRDQRLARSHRYAARPHPHSHDLEPLAYGDHLTNSSSGRVEVLRVPQTSVGPMWLKDRRDADNADVVDCAVFPACNSLKLHKVREVKSPAVNLNHLAGAGEFDFTAARNVGFMPPSAPIVTGIGGMLRLISSVVSTSSRRCFSRTAAAMSSGTL